MPIECIANTLEQTARTSRMYQNRMYWLNADAASMLNTTKHKPQVVAKNRRFQSATYLSLYLHASSFPPSRPHFLCLETDTQSAQPYFSAVSVLCILIFLFNLNLYSTHYPCSSVKLSEKSSIILTVSSPISAIIFLEMIISKTDNTV